MEKGKYGIKLSFYAVMAFILVIFGYYTLLFLLAGVVLIGEKNEWACRQVIEAICLSFVLNVISSVFGIFDFVYRIPYIGTAWGTVINVITSLVEIAVWVFAIIAIVRTAKGKEAGIPLADRFANWAYGKLIVKPQPVYQQPMQGQPVYQQPVQQAQPADVCVKCGAPLNGGAFCTKCGAPANK
ncbi:MAG TPA: zinc ribbon domain-containing protein [Lachnospiraceae bacterium]|nr:zinc ribbon domain-containing protein [Lachnospiraceae bacterium]